MKDSINIKIKRLPNCHSLPTRATEHAAGWDLYSSVKEIVPAGCYSIIPCGFSIEIPLGYEGQVRPRSGMAAKMGITVLNAPGTIDSDYRGEVKVILINHGFSDRIIDAGDRIAQLVISPVQPVAMVEVDTLDETARGDGGFGSTGR